MKTNDAAPLVEQCPQCRSSSEVGPYANEAGIKMMACGRCLIQFRAELASHAPAVPPPPSDELTMTLENLNDSLNERRISQPAALKWAFELGVASRAVEGAQTGERDE